jgi:hypothetical protein
MSEVYQKFIRSMRRKYNGMLQPSTNPLDAMSGKEPGSGKFSRFTGNGVDNKLQESEPVGVHHEGEAVVSAPVLRNIGGPEALDAQLAEAQKNTGKMPTEGDFVPRGLQPAKFGASGRRLPGYQFADGAGSNEIDPGHNIDGGTSNFIDVGGNTTNGSGNFNESGFTPPPGSSSGFVRSDAVGANDPAKAADAAEFIDGVNKPPPNPLTKTGADSPELDQFGIPIKPVQDIGIDPPPPVKTTTVRPDKPEIGIDPAPPVDESRTIKTADGGTKTFNSRDFDSIDDYRAAVDAELARGEDIDPTVSRIDPGEKPEFEAGVFTPEEIEERQKSERQLQAEALSDEQIRELQRIQAGEGTASKVAGEIARNKLAGSLAAGQQAGSQFAAQAGLTGGALNAFVANQRRESQLAQTGLSRDLAIDQVNRMENATLKLAEMATNQQAFEEATRQWGSNFDLAKENFGLDVAKFNEFSKQFAASFDMDWAKLGVDAQKANVLSEQFEKNFGLALQNFAHNVSMDGFDVAMRKMMADHTIGSWKANSMMALDSPEGYKAAGEIFKSMGIDVDMDSLIANANSDQFGRNIADALDNMELVDDDFVWTDKATGELTDEAFGQTSTKNFLDAYNNANGTDWTIDNVKSDPKALKWLTDTINTRTTMGSYAYQIAQDFDDGEIWGLFSEIPSVDANGNLLNDAGEVVINPEDAAKKWTSIADFDWGGANPNGTPEGGQEAARLAVANLIMTGGLSTNLDGTTSSDSNVVWNTLFGNTPTSAGSSTGVSGDDTPQTPQSLTQDFADFYNENKEAADALGLGPKQIQALAGENLEDASRVLTDESFRDFRKILGETKLPTGIGFDEISATAQSLADKSGSADAKASDFMDQAIKDWVEVGNMDPDIWKTKSDATWEQAHIIDQKGDVEKFSHIKDIPWERNSTHTLNENGFISVGGNLYKMEDSGLYKTEINRSRIPGEYGKDHDNDMMKVTTEEGLEFYLDEDNNMWATDPRRFFSREENIGDDSSYEMWENKIGENGFTKHLAATTIKEPPKDEREIRLYKDWLARNEELVYYKDDGHWVLNLDEVVSWEEARDSASGSVVFNKEE